jgi:hypothetical protein
VTSYPTPKFRRPALAPGILGAIVLIAGLALLDNPGGYLFIKFGVAILALIMCVFAWQARQWWWIIGLAVRFQRASLGRLAIRRVAALRGYRVAGEGDQPGRSQSV